jgi:CRISPR/Cas system CMR-associated protein Cmr5 small subunit
MPFSELMTDNIDLLKKDGGKYPGLKASVQRKGIYLNAGDLRIEAGDLIQRNMSNGAKETYEVIDPGFREGLDEIPAHYQLEVKRLERAEAAKESAKEHSAGAVLTLIANSRLDELRKLAPTDFDLKKLVRLCEEINTTYSSGCYFATAMLTRGLLDHVPPLFGKSTFSEVANKYSGGGKSFKETINHLENAARKIADAHLHMPIRKSETLPSAQQVNFAPQLDVLLSEIIRTTSA